MKHTYRVEFNGQVFKRTTARQYTHLVVGRPNLALAIENAKASRAHHLKNHAFYVQEANPATRRYDRTPERQAEYDKLAAMSSDELADSLVAQRLAEIDKQVAGGVFAAYYPLGWSSRRDLAQKNAAAHAGRYVDLKVLEVKS